MSSYHTPKPLEPGTAVTALVRAASGNTIGAIACLVLNAQSVHEVDLLVVPSEDNIEQLIFVLDEEGLEESDLREGPVYVLRNWQTDDIKECN